MCKFYIIPILMHISVVVCRAIKSSVWYSLSKRVFHFNEKLQFLQCAKYVVYQQIEQCT